MLYQSVQDKHRNSSLRSAKAIHEDLLTNFRTCARGSGICRSFSQELKYWQYSHPPLAWLARCLQKPVLVPSFCLTSITHPTHAPLEITQPAHTGRRSFDVPSTLPHLAGSPSIDRYPHRPTIALPHPVGPGWDRCSPQSYSCPKGRES